MKSLQQLERIKLSNLLTDKVKKLDDNDAMVDETIETDFKIFIQKAQAAEAQKATVPKSCLTYGALLLK